MTKYESILNALSASKNTFSEEDLLNLYELLLHAYAKGTPARGTIWNVILRDPRLSQFKEKLVKQFLWEYKELLERFLRAYNTPPVRNAANLSNGSCGNTTNSPPFQETWIDFQMTLQCSTLWSISVRENIMGNGSSGRLIQTAQILPLLMHTLKTPLKNTPMPSLIRIREKSAIPRDTAPASSSTSTIIKNMGEKKILQISSLKASTAHMTTRYIQTWTK